MIMRIHTNKNVFVGDKFVKFKKGEDNNKNCTTFDDLISSLVEVRIAPDAVNLALELSLLLGSIHFVMDVLPDTR